MLIQPLRAPWEFSRRKLSVTHYLSARFLLVFLVLYWLLTICSVFPSAATATTNRYISVNGADTGSCTTVAFPCRTFNYVDRQAGSGDHVVHMLARHLQPDRLHLHCHATPAA